MVVFKDLKSLFIIILEIIRLLYFGFTIMVVESTFCIFWEKKYCFENRTLEHLNWFVIFWIKLCYANGKVQSLNQRKGWNWRKIIQIACEMAFQSFYNNYGYPLMWAFTGRTMIAWTGNPGTIIYNVFDILYIIYRWVVTRPMVAQSASLLIPPVVAQKFALGMTENN